MKASRKARPLGPRTQAYVQQLWDDGGFVPNPEAPTSPPVAYFLAVVRDGGGRGYYYEVVQDGEQRALDVLQVMVHEQLSLL